MNISIVKEEACTGCLACVYICGKKCIQKTKNKEGFIYPQVQMTSCVDCGKCVSVCPACKEVNKKEKAAFTPKVYAVQSKKQELLKESASGGVGSLISSYIIESKGVVYGAIMSPELKVQHKKVSSQKDIRALSGSKYVQSDFSRVFESIRKSCNSNSKVVVFGTPCQIYALRRFLHKDYSNLYLVDLICHGVPSPDLFEKYIVWKTKRMNDGPIKDYRFRDKSLNGWDTSYKATTEHKVSAAEATKDPYYFSFIYAQTYRECCYNCNFASRDRCGDITIGDYWGITKYHELFKKIERKGVSALICNTLQGEQLFEQIKNNLIYEESKFEQVVEKNPNLIHPAHRPNVRNDIYDQINKNGINWLQKMMYFDRRYYTEAIKRKVPKLLKDRIRSLIK